MVVHEDPKLFDEGVFRHELIETVLYLVLLYHYIIKMRLAALLLFLALCRGNCEGVDIAGKKVIETYKECWEDSGNKNRLQITIQYIECFGDNQEKISEDFERLL